MLLKGRFNTSFIEVSPDKIFEKISSLEDRLILSGINHLNKEEKAKWFNSQFKLPQSFSLQEFTLLNSSEKNNILNSLSVFLDQFDLSSRLNQLIMTVSDEFISNSFFDAPNNSEEYFETDRRETVFTKNVDFMFGNNDKEIGISIVDYYGNLNIEKLIQHFSQDYVSKEYIPSAEQGGAGLGLFLCLKRNVSILIEFKENEYTKFTAFFPIVSSYKDYLNNGQMVGLNVKK